MMTQRQDRAHQWTPDGLEVNEEASTHDRGADEGYVLCDARGQQVNPLTTTMTLAEALEDSLGPR